MTGVELQSKARKDKSGYQDLATCLSALKLFIIISHDPRATPRAAALVYLEHPSMQLPGYHEERRVDRTSPGNPQA